MSDLKAFRGPISVSLGVRAVEGVKEAVNHAHAFPTHDPVLYLALDFESDPVQEVHWRCSDCLKDYSWNHALYVWDNGRGDRGISCECGFEISDWPEDLTVPAGVSVDLLVRLGQEHVLSLALAPENP